MSATKRILSLDGGGTWAIIQVEALIDLYGRDARGHAILSHFDLAVATSGGALVLGGLAADRPRHRRGHFTQHKSANETLEDADRVPCRLIRKAGSRENTKNGLTQLSRRFLIFGIVDIRIAKRRNSQPRTAERKATHGMRHRAHGIRAGFPLHRLFNLPPQSLIARDGKRLLHLRDRIHLPEKGLHFGNQIGGDLLVPARSRRLDDVLNLRKTCAVERSHGHLTTSDRNKLLRRHRNGSKNGSMNVADANGKPTFQFKWSASRAAKYSPRGRLYHSDGNDRRKPILRIGLTP